MPSRRWPSPDRGRGREGSSWELDEQLVKHADLSGDDVVDRADAILDGSLDGHERVVASKDFACGHCVAGRDGVPVDGLSEVDHVFINSDGPAHDRRSFW